MTGTNRAADSTPRTLGKLAAGPRGGRPRRLGSGARMSRMLMPVAIDHRPIAEVVLQPMPRLGDPQAVHPDMPQPPRGTHLRERPPRRPVRALVTERDQLLVRLVGTDLPLRRLDPFLDLGQKRVGDPTPIRRLRNRTPRVPGGNMPGHGVVRAAGEFGRRA